MSELTIDAGEWDTTETKTLKPPRGTPQFEVLYRYLNDLDADVDVAFKVTDEHDSAYDYAEQTDTRTVTAGSLDGVLLTEPWERVAVEVTPQTSPSTGTFTLRTSGE